MLKRVIAVGVLAAAVGLWVPAGMAAASTSTTDATSTTSTTSTTVAPSKSKPRDLNGARQRCESMIDARLAELNKLDARIDNATRLTPAHRQQLVDINSRARAGLTDLRTKIAQDNDPAVLKQDCQSIILDFRIFALRVPQEHLVIASDAESAVVARLQALEPKLEAAIDQAKAHGKDVHDAERAFDDFKAKLADAAKHDDQVSDTVLGITPADYNANHRVLMPAREDVKATAADLHAAARDARTIVRDLRQQRPATTTTTTG